MITPQDMLEWLDVAGYVGRYQISSCGQLRKAETHELVGQWVSDQGYCLARFSNPRKVVRVHRLVCEAFVLNPKGKKTVNHIDCVRSNNHASNLEWCTQKENVNHSRNLNRYKDYWKGKRSPNARLSEDIVTKIKRLRNIDGFSWGKISEITGVNKKTVGSIIANKCYLPLPAAPQPPEGT